MTTTYGAQFRSNSDEIKHYIREYLKDKQPHLRKDIMTYVEDQTGNTTYTDGQWAGSFQAILKIPGYISPRTGVYQYTGVLELVESESQISNVSSTMVACRDILDKAIEELKANIKKADIFQKNPLELSAEEFAELKRLRNFIQQVEDIKI